MPAIEPRYDAFISYNHAADGRLAPAVERGLQRLAKPWYRLRAMSIFRDMSDTGLNPSMWGHVQERLAESRWLILMACPESAASLWVQQEVDHWCEHRGVDSILIVLTGGEIVWDRDLGGFSDATTALTPEFAARFESEPLHLDLRWAHEVAEPSLALARFRADMARLASPIRGLPPDEIEGEDIRLHRKARRLARGAVAVLVTLAIIASVAAVVAVVNARRADRRAREATAKQLGLLALDLPARDLDRALLLSVVASELDPEVGAERFRASRTLIGRHSRLRALLYGPPGDDPDASLRGVAVSPDGERVAAFGSTSDGMPRVLSWTPNDRTGPAVPAALPVGELSGPALDFDTGGSIVVGAAGQGLTVQRSGAILVEAPLVLAVDLERRRAVVSDGAVVQLIDLASGDEIAAWPSTADDAAALAAERVALLVDGSLLLVEASTGQLEASAGADVDAAALAVDPDADRIVTVSAGGELSTWEADDGSLTRTVVSAIDVGRPLRVEWGGADRVVVLGDGGFAIVDVVGGSVVATDPAIGELAFDPSGRFAAVGGTQLAVWDVELGQRVIAVSEKVNAMAWNDCTASRCRLVTAGEALDVWEPASGRRVRLGDQTNAQAVDITADGATVVSGGWGPAVALWDLTVPIDDSGRTRLVEAGQPSAADPVTRATARHDGDRTVIVTAGAGADDDDGADQTVVETGTIDTMQLLAGSSRLLVAHDGAYQLFDVVAGTRIDLDPRCAGGLVATSPRGRHLLVHDAGTRATVVCSTDDGSFVAGGIVDVTTAPTSAVAVDDDGSVALGGNGFVVFHRRDGQVLATGRAVDARFGGESVAVTALALDRGRLVAGVRPESSDAPARVLIWDADIDGTPVQFDTDHGNVPAVALLGEASEFVVTAGGSGADDPIVLQVWERDTRRRLGRGLGGLVGDVVSLAGDATALVGTDADGRTFRWSLERDPTREVCEIVGRQLRPDEWSSVAGGALDRYDFSPVCPDGRATDDLRK